MTPNNRVTNIILSVMAVTMTAIFFSSISAPRRFKNEQTERERDVKHHLLAIREAEERYFKDYGRYCASFDSLTAGGYMADSLKFIPHSNGILFRLKTTENATKAGNPQPLMECGATFRDYLIGMDSNTITNLMEEAEAQGKYPGLCIGNLTSDNGNAGNWE